MGFTPLEGLVMGTRSGDLDPGVLLFLAGQGFDWKALDEGLNRQSGLRGLSGASDDVRELLELEAGGHSGARLALDTFCMRICKYVGAYAAVLGGVDAIAVGGGIGEHSAVLRARVLGRLGWLGVELDAEANANARLDGSTDVNTDSNAAMTANGTSARISTPGSAVSVHVVRVDEEPIIAQAVLDVLNRA